LFGVGQELTFAALLIKKIGWMAEPDEAERNLSISEDIHAKLTAELAPQSLTITNESHLHAGHQQAFDGSGETHLRIRVVSSRFSSLSRVERHRKVNALCREAFERGLHALAIEAKAPEEG
jgi:BolA family transcriptional regulator, general stress-responsive regulator